MKVDLFGSEGSHGNESVPVPTGAALVAAAGKFVDGGPGPRFRSFGAQPLFLVAGFDVRRLTFLFVRVAGLIALRHEQCFLGSQAFLGLWLSGQRHVNAQRRREINFMLLLLDNDAAQSFAQGKLPHRLGLLDALAISPHGHPFVFQIGAQHFNRIG